MREAYGMSARCGWLPHKMLGSQSAIKAVTISANTVWAPRTTRRMVGAKDMFASVVFTAGCEYLRRPFCGSPRLRDERKKNWHAQRVIYSSCAAPYVMSDPLNTGV